ncbi:hypothetical protein CCM_06312 [Cordyceps militaris CM01]|uniref:Uncharacterized protein n=1 Tax=Cordyceps militaris (strain CM01) TaxID=983644 RepID=G3JK21_CORMM|nr:uncharacterized protein CCM_06312 [Cordyceps militaris CM01]EGX92151.1 hypothetical protein CCM_06312 [Cordyceps militaris CM01]
MGCGGSRPVKKLDLSGVEPYDLVVIACPPWCKRHLLVPCSPEELDPEEERLPPEQKERILIHLLTEYVDKVVRKPGVGKMRLCGSGEYTHESNDYYEVLCVAWDAAFASQLSAEVTDHFTQPLPPHYGVKTLPDGPKFVYEPITGGGKFIVLDSLRKGEDQK